MLAAGFGGCTQTHWQGLPYPIPLTLSGGSGGGLMGAITFTPAGDQILPVVIDTGSVLTVYDDGSGQTGAPRGNFTLDGVLDGADIPRLFVEDVQLFAAPLGALGMGTTATKVGAILAGDQLTRFAVALDYRGQQPAMTVTSGLQPCNCEYQPQPEAPQCASRFDCSAMLPFSLAGGQDNALQSQTRVIIGDNQYTYPPTRVLIDACLEPYPDPLTTTVPGQPDYATCVAHAGDCPAAPYLPSGVDTELLLATGFPGLALSSSLYDRLRGVGAAAALFAAGSTTLQLPDAADTEAGGIQVAQTTLGRLVDGDNAGAAALALVSHEYYFGPCASLARSRRMRRFAAAGESTCALPTPVTGVCNSGGTMIADPYSAACRSSTGNNYRCNDQNPHGPDTPTASVLELAATLPVYVLPDVAPILLAVNADVRPAQATVEGVIGTTVLAELVMTIDYPNNRLLARCASEDDCKAYPRLSIPGEVPSICDRYCHGAHPDDALWGCGGAFAACTVAP